MVARDDRGRVCAQDGCQTVLSKYNPLPICSVHTAPGMTRYDALVAAANALPTSAAVAPGPAELAVGFEPTTERLQVADPPTDRPTSGAGTGRGATDLTTLTPDHRSGAATTRHAGEQPASEVAPEPSPKPRVWAPEPGPSSAGYSVETQLGLFAEALEFTDTDRRRYRSGDWLFPTKGRPR